MSFICKCIDRTLKHIGTGIIQCTKCNETLNILNRQDPLESSKLAHEYVCLTGDLNIPCEFPFVDVPGILPKKIKPTPISVLYNSIELLRAINAPFVDSKIAQNSNSEILQHFFTEYTKAMEKLSSANDGSPERQLVFRLISQLKSLTETNILDHYFKTLVPYVWSCHEQQCFLPEEPNIQTLPPAYQFLIELKRSVQIRSVYSKYCIPFDVVHIMVYCYACSHDEEIVANLAFDLLNRLCKGQFFNVNTPYVQEVQKIINNNVTFKQNTDLYYVVRSIRNGEACECLSTFLEKYAQLEKFVSTHFKSGDDFARGQAFPYTLFQTNSDYLGFVLALGHVATTMQKNNGKISKGLFATSRKLHRIIKTMVEKMNEFDTEYWTLDTFQMFLAQDDTFEKQVREMAELVLRDESSNEDE
ncbi:uncharacterized protein TNIN_179541 [Trichonephila inaurata madagascariensis]|uniref:Uncharacterized protein n=1 Tax=Trichonephila inaurata madagascariensis TaxID=2747483 RepID=A0A8X6Y6D5_9ARAC|nr:uncharacterized protein TNIN_179541 [Trichonephila inaurata madagascariensis]